MVSAYRVVTDSSDALVIAAPGSSMLFSWIGLVMLAVLTFALYSSGRTVRRVLAPDRSAEQLSLYVARWYGLGTLIIVAILLLFWALFYSSGVIRLDRTSNRATMSAKMTFFLPAQTQSIPLSSVDEAVLDAKPNARRIRLVTKEGEDLAFPIFSDRSGQDAAVKTINTFLHSSH